MFNYSKVGIESLIVWKWIIDVKRELFTIFTILKGHCMLIIIYIGWQFATSVVLLVKALRWLAGRVIAVWVTVEMLKDTATLSIRGKSFYNLDCSHSINMLLFRVWWFAETHLTYFNHLYSRARTSSRNHRNAKF